MTTRRRGRWHARWQWRRKVLPGLRVNLSLGGPSVTIGPKWYHSTFGRNRTRSVIDPPGPGYIERVHSQRHVRAQRHGCLALLFVVIGAALVAIMALRHAVTLQGVLLVVGCYLGMHWSLRRRGSARRYEEG
jgi:uncharacterized protein DUF4236